MKSAYHSITKIRVYLLCCLLIIVVGTIATLLFDKTALHLAINKKHNAFWDALFPYLTHLGDGLTFIVIVLLFVFISKKQRYQYLVLGGLSILISGLSAQLLKRLVFPDAYRPVKYIGQEFLYLVPDVDVHAYNSFPSGHATTTFALVTFVLFVSRYRHWSMQILAALLAIFISYSRIYLSQHFLEDVVCGAVLGILSYVLAHFICALMPFKQNLVKI